MLLSYRGAELIGWLARSSGRGFEEFTSEGALKKLVKTFVSALPECLEKIFWIDRLCLVGVPSSLGEGICPSSKIPRYTLEKTG